MVPEFEEQNKNKSVGVVVGLIQNEGFLEVVESLSILFSVETVKSDWLESGKRAVERQGRFELFLDLVISHKHFHNSDSPERVGFELAWSLLYHCFDMRDAFSGLVYSLLLLF